MWFKPSLNTHSNRIISLRALLPALLFLLSAVRLYAQTQHLDGKTPGIPLIYASDGNLYGITTYGGDFGYGTVYKLTRIGSRWRYKVIHSFSGNTNPQRGPIDGAGPGTLMEGPNCIFYGTCGGGLYQHGAIFKMDTSGNVTLTYSFKGYNSLNPPMSDASGPIGSIVRTSDGSIYGVSLQGGAYDYGCVYKVDVTGHETTLLSFIFGEAVYQSLGVIMANDGNIYGVDPWGENPLDTEPGEPFPNQQDATGEIFKVDPIHSTATVLYYFPDDYSGPWSTPTWLVQGADGFIYGNAQQANSHPPPQFPTGAYLYRMDFSGNLSLFYASGSPGANGLFPAMPPLPNGSQGYYAITEFTAPDTSYASRIFTIDTSGNTNILYDTKESTQGAVPGGPLILGSDGKLYGTNTLGGTYYNGTLFSFDPKTGVYTTLHHFGAPAQQAQPISPPWAYSALAWDTAPVDGAGPSSADWIDLNTGVEENRPGPDIVVRNPIGPDAVYSRFYRSDLADSGYASPGLSPGWVDNFDVKIQGGGMLGCSVLLEYPNGAVEPLKPEMNNGQPTGNLFPPSGAPYLATGSPVANPGQWYWNSITLTFKDLSQWTFTPDPDTPDNYILTQITNLLGSALSINRDPSNQNRVTSLVSVPNGVTLLTFTYNGTLLSALTDVYGRQINYGYGTTSGVTCLTNVSQITGSGGSAPDQWQYSYITLDNAPYLSSVSVPDPSGVNGMVANTINYDPNALAVTSLVDANKNQRLYTYNNGYTTIQVKDPNNNIIQTWTQNIDSLGRDIGTGDFQYADSAQYTDSNNIYQPTVVTNKDMQSVTLTYDQNAPYIDQIFQVFSGNPSTATAMVNGNPLTTTYTYDYSSFLLGRVIKIQDNGGKGPTNFSYYPNGLLQTVAVPTPGISGGGSQVTANYTYTSLGNVATETVPSPTGGTATTTYNYTYDPYDGTTKQEALGEPLTVTDANGNVTHFRYDGRGNVTTVIDPLGNHTDYQYNLADQVTQVMYPPIGGVSSHVNISRSALTYNSSNHTYNGTLTVTDTNNMAIVSPIVVFTNLPPGVTLSNATGYYQGSPYISPASTLQPNSPVQIPVVFYDPNQTPVTYNNESFSGVSGRTTIVYAYRYPGGPAVTSTLYDENGAKARQITDTLGVEGETTSTTGSVLTVKAAYDPQYRLKNLLNGNNNSTVNSYDNVGNLIRQAFPMYNASTGFDSLAGGYDPDYNLTKRTDGRNQVTQYSLAPDDSRLETVLYPSNTLPNISYLYDAYDRVKQVSDGATTLAYTYDDLDNVTSVTTTYSGLPPQTISYNYNPDGSRESMTTPAGTFYYQYDQAGRLTSLTNPFSETFTWTYLPNDAVQTQTSQVVTSYAYNSRGFLIDLTNRLNNSSYTELSDFGSLYHDPVGNLTSQVAWLAPHMPGTSYSGPTTYAYDNLDQLLQEGSGRNGGYGNVFAYDPDGNPTTMRGGGLTFNADDQFNLSGYTYDGEGNPTLYNNTGLTFDLEDRLTAVSGLLTMNYREDGLRAWKQNSSGVRTYFLYDGSVPVCELNASGTVIATNTFGVTGLLDRHSGQTSVFYTFDPEGNVVQRISGGSVVDAFLFDAYGLRQSTGSSTDPYTGFGSQAGYYWDSETGLELMGYRYYDAAKGRFLTRDPSGYDGGINLYAFCDNNPVNCVDPLGLDPPTPGDILDQTLFWGSTFIGAFVGGAGGGLGGGGISGGALAVPGAAAGALKGAAVGSAVGVTLVVLRHKLADWMASRSQSSPGQLTLPNMPPAPARSAASLRASANYINGRSAANALRNMFRLQGIPTTLEEPFNTSLGIRKIDVWDPSNLNAFECKVGRTSAGSFIRDEVAKDAELLRSGVFRKVYWHFFRSPVTKEIGPTPRLERMLRQAGISIIEHP